MAAAYYWKKLFPDFLEFRRERYGPPPNNLLNYGYAILRAVVARSLVSSGLLPTLGIFHKNQYNVCLREVGGEVQCNGLILREPDLLFPVMGK
jgi:CRISPR-associated protein Cas1